MQKLLELVKFEILLHNRSFHLVRSGIYTMLTVTVMLFMVLKDHEGNSYNNLILCLFASVLVVISVPSYLFKNDYVDGNLEFLLCNMSPWKIVLGKYLALLLSFSVSIFFAHFISYFIMGYSSREFIFLLAVIFFILVQTSLLVSFGNIVQAYFKTNTGLITSIITPLIVPCLILGSIALETMKIDYLMILLGIDIILIPLVLAVSSYLVSNIYNF